MTLKKGQRARIEYSQHHEVLVELEERLESLLQLKRSAISCLGCLGRESGGLKTVRSTRKAFHDY